MHANYFLFWNVLLLAYADENLSKSSLAKKHSKTFRTKHSTRTNKNRKMRISHLNQLLLGISLLLVQKTFSCQKWMEYTVNGIISWMPPRSSIRVCVLSTFSHAFRATQFTSVNMLFANFSNVKWQWNATGILWLTYFTTTSYVSYEIISNGLQ